MKRTLFIKLSTTQIIMLSFLITILLGSILLFLPVSSATGGSVSYMDALFTATTSVCVTGLVTVPTVSTWSIFGQVVILILIQVGGLGVITIMSMIMIGFHKKMGIGERMLLQDAFNLNTMSGLSEFVRKVVGGTLLVEMVGAIGYMTVFVPRYGIRGVWISVFNAVSAFCNAGMDVIAENSLCDYALNPMVNVVTCTLIVVSGIGYIVWWDVLNALTKWKTHKLRCFRSMTLHSKIAIGFTVILIVAGAVSFFVFEYNNPLTMANCSLADRIQLSVFQSVTTRTAGFATIPQENLTNASALVSLLLMFIGGSPVGTAGGVKTVTMAVLIMSALATIQDKNEVSLFGRSISKQAVSKSVAVVSMAFVIMFISTLLLAGVTDADLLDIMYETVSATATVGLSRNLTASLNTWGKIIIVITMYLGRVGPISLAVAMNMHKEKKNIVSNPVEMISIG